MSNGERISSGMRNQAIAEADDYQDHITAWTAPISKPT
jgi:hypothetical protein